jgi:hypothetical protein
VKVLTVKNPWAYLIIFGGKDIENRVRKTNYRGRIAIHCSKESDRLAYMGYGGNDPVLKKAFEEVCEKRAEIEKLNGKIIGTVEIYNCSYPALTVQVSNSPWIEMISPWHYWLKNPEPLKEPISARGMLGLWNYSSGLIV